MKVFITGGCGFFGTWIIARLFEHEAAGTLAKAFASDESHAASALEITVFDAVLNTSRWEMVLTAAQIAAVKFVQGRVDTEELGAAIVSLAPHAVIHLAGVQVPTCRDNPVLGARVNVIGSLNVFEAFKALRAAGQPLPRLVYASSAAVFGPEEEYAAEGAAATVGDNAVPRPSSHYGAFKLCVEHAARCYSETNGVPSVGFRPLTVYGPGRDVGLTSAPTRALAAAVLGKKFEIPFTGPTAYVHVREVADMFVNAILTPTVGAKVFTVGGDTVDVASFLSIASRVLPAIPELITASGGALPIVSHLDDAALRAAYPDVIRLPLEQGVRETVDVFRRLAAEGKLAV